MDGHDRPGYEPPTRGERWRAALKVWAIYAGWALLAAGVFWILFNLPPEVSGFLRGLFRILGAFS